MRICLICIDDIYNLAVGIDCQTAIRLLTSSVREQMYNTTASLFQVIKVEQRILVSYLFFFSILFLRIVKKQK